MIYVVRTNREATKKKLESNEQILVFVFHTSGLTVALKSVFIILYIIGILIFFLPTTKVIFIYDNDLIFLLFIYYINLTGLIIFPSTFTLQMKKLENILINMVI